MRLQSMLQDYRLARRLHAAAAPIQRARGSREGHEPRRRRINWQTSKGSVQLLGLVEPRFDPFGAREGAGRPTLSRRCPGRGLTPAQTPFPLGAYGYGLLHQGIERTRRGFILRSKRTTIANIP
jgi:hypothetical protein